MRAVLVQARVPKGCGRLERALRACPHASRRIAAQPRCWPNEPKGHFGQTKPRGLKNQPAAVANERRLPASVSGLLFTMDGATPTCRAVSAPVADVPHPGRCWLTHAAA